MPVGLASFERLGVVAGQEGAATSALTESAGKIFNLFPPARRRLFVAQHPDFVFRLMGHLMHVIADDASPPADVTTRLSRLFGTIDQLAELSPAQARDRYFDCLDELQHNRE